MPLPDTFKVKVEDKASGREHELTVSRTSTIQDQQAAEEYVRNMKTSFGGKHPGFDVIPANASANAAPVPNQES